VIESTYFLISIFIFELSYSACGVFTASGVFRTASPF
jgi:hypothetical protein